MSTSARKLLLLSGLVLFAVACTNRSADQKAAAFDETKLIEKLSLHGGITADCEHVFVVSQYQCKGCTERVLSAMVSEDFKSIFESSCWIASTPKPEQLEGHAVSWDEVSQVDIEKIIPYAANITYIRIKPSGIEAFQELGVKWVEPRQLKLLFEQKPETL